MYIFFYFLNQKRKIINLRKISKFQNFKIGKFRNFKMRTYNNKKAYAALQGNFLKSSFVETFVQKIIFEHINFFLNVCVWQKLKF